MQHLAGGARTHGLRLSRMSSAVDARPDFSDGASQGLGGGPAEGIDKSVGVGLVEKAHGEDDLLHGDAVLFAVVGDLHALGVAEDGCEDARERDGAFGFGGAAILAGDDALDAVAPQDDKFVADELHALEEALVEGGIPNVEVKFALVVAMETATSLPTTWWAIWITISESVGLILPGMMELPRLRAAAGPP